MYGENSALLRAELSTLLKTEGEIVYLDVAGKKTDELLEIDVPADMRGRSLLPQLATR